MKDYNAHFRYIVNFYLIFNAIMFFDFFLYTVYLVLLCHISVDLLRLFFQFNIETNIYMCILI